MSRVNCGGSPPPPPPVQSLYQILVLSVLVSFITQTSGLR